MSKWNMDHPDIKKAVADGKVYGILDKFHLNLTGGKTPEVRSDDPVFEGDPTGFFWWCITHGAYEKWYEIKEGDNNVERRSRKSI